MATNSFDHRPLATDNLSDGVIQNIQYWLGATPTVGGNTVTADAVATVPLTVQGAGTTQTGDLLDVKQNSGGNMLFQVATVSGGATGVKITSAAAASGVTIAAISSGTNENLLVTGKGTGNVNLAANIATPAAGSLAAAVLLGTTAAFGIYYGSNAPTVAAAQGSLYLRSDGSSTSTRAYVATNGSGTWTAVTTAA